MANGDTPWGSEDPYAMDGTTVDVAPAPVDQNVVTIGQKDWLTGPAGPVPLGGKGIRMTGGTPFVPQPIPSWAIPKPAAPAPLLPQEALGEIFQQAGPDVALKAFDSARKLEGKLAFDAALKSGVPVSEAILRYGPQMYSPSEARSMQAAYPTPFTPRSVKVGQHELLQVGPQHFIQPTQAMPVIDPTKPMEAVPITAGGVATGRFAVPSKTGLHIVSPKEEPTPKAGLQLTALAKVIEQTEKQLDMARTPEERTLLEGKLTQLRTSLENVAGGIVGETKTGKKAPPPIGTVIRGYRYKGPNVPWEKVQ